MHLLVIINKFIQNARYNNQSNQVVFLSIYVIVFVTVEACHRSPVAVDDFCQDGCVNYGHWSDVIMS